MRRPDQYQTHPHRWRRMGLQCGYGGRCVWMTVVRRI
ncbi:unnamed protein product [Chondrus crispus]|uniref:Uncharacterized protein n=1 Tax=Chondrus crispus TaxID=2769 RepID=R7Q7A9_CHOCR|nr:unnamed protein product [Chondrus crispus]CDF33713.1 unnamed protein product [Chondrus crispus]|eukprot:XP_005713532.1 unnamed protein product [Chondrus crispus]